VLLVSTDPAHSLGDALDATLAPSARRIVVGRARRLDAVELDADRALARWLAHRRRTLGTIAERGTYLDREDVARFLGLSLPGVDELIGLLELVRLARARAYDEIVVDTAPTGHTLRLLEMPETLRRIASVLDDMQAKHRFLSASLGGAHVPDAADRLVEEIDADGKALAELLRDPARCAFAWVLLPERLALEEARDGVRRLDEAGISVDEIVVNRVTPPSARCPLCRARAGAEHVVLDAIRTAFRDRVVRVLPADESEPRGVAALRRVGARLAESPARARRTLAAVVHPRDAQRRKHARSTSARARTSAPPWLDALAPRGIRLCLVGGKGGVGKTTCAVAIALALARRDHARRVLLLSTDPAHSLGDAIGSTIGDDEVSVSGAPDNLKVRELDADRAFRSRRERYRDAVDRAFTAVLGRGGVDITFDRAVVRELLELAPPGLDELFGMLTVIDALFRPTAPWDTVVVDTAPTGHTLRLLRMPATALAWVRALIAIVLKYRAVVGLGDFAADLVEVSRDLRRLEGLLADAERTRFVPVTRAAELPRRETVRLLAALARLDAPAPTIVVNAVTPETSAQACPRCARVARTEAREIAALARDARRRERDASIVRAPAVAPPPRGIADIEAWSATWSGASATR
jgi:arsenite/tail-anchored protein-transporting ATPase